MKGYREETSISSNIRPSVLIVDDQSVILHTLCVTLSKKNYDLLVANSGKQALKIIQNSKPDLILLDILMPDMSGIEVCKELKNDIDLRQIPVIFLTSSEDFIDDAFEAGGVDYILKPFKNNELISRVKTHLKISKLNRSLEEANFILESLNANLEKRVQERTRDLVSANSSLRNEISERRRLQDKLEYLSKYDFVTRMLNRKSMEELIDSEVAKHLNSDKTECLYFLFIDLDQFKIINDTCGHTAGDELLRQISEVIKSMESDYQLASARMGGDEFGIFFRAKNSGSAHHITESIFLGISGFRFNWYESTYSVALSMGLVELNESIGNAKTAISTAERTCYESKLKGGSNISYYNESRENIDQDEKQMRWVPILQKAQDDNKLSLHFQSIVDIKTGERSKAEILIRLIGDDGNLVYPDAFIPVAERYHLISNIDLWVIRQALSIKKALSDPTQISINISGESFNKSGFINNVEEIIKQTNVTPNEICFEITETSALSNIEATKVFIDHMHDLGCRSSLDDFGTGTSTFSYLKQLPVDFLKVDQMFIRDIENEKINRMMVESITSICKEMDVKVIAEGVETESELNTLKKIGVDFIQGYYYHRPAPYTAQNIDING